MSSEAMDFRASPRLSIGVELELQILNSRDYNLARDAARLREMHGKPGSLNDVARCQSEEWMGERLRAD